MNNKELEVMKMHSRHIGEWMILCKQLEQELADLKEQYRWRDVSEELPDENGYYRCTLINPRHSNKTFLGSIFYHKKHGWDSKSKVIGWKLPEQPMPLPDDEVE